ncbi:MAG: hypothetical protein ACLU37_11235 [Collinsella sp.]
MGIALLVLAVIPLVVAACYPQHWSRGATKFNAAGGDAGAKLRAAGAAGAQLAAELATYFTAGRQAENNDDSAAMARIVCGRYLRSSCSRACSST